MKKLIFIHISIILFSISVFAQASSSSSNGVPVAEERSVQMRKNFTFAEQAGEWESHNLPGEVASGDERFDRIFREGRELMDKEEWNKAAAKFTEIVCDCPEKKEVDAALYWLAYCYKKQKMYKETNSTIERLLKSFPDSEWADDARVLNYQILAPSKTGDAVVFTTSGQTTSSAVAYSPSASSSEFKVLTETKGTGVFNGVQVNKLEREDEIKLAAFQSLWAADPKKGVEIMNSIFGANSKASENLKIQILRTLQGNRFTYRIGDGGSFSTVSSVNMVNQINPSLREALGKAYQTEVNTKVKQEILYSVAYINDEISVNYLAQIYANEVNKDLKRAVINSFALVPYAGFTGYAYSTYGNDIAVATSEQNKAQTTVQKAQEAYNSTNKTPENNPVRELRFNKLMEIFRNEKDIELKRLAFTTLQRFKGWSGRSGIVEMLVQIYDAETDEKFKQLIISSFGNLAENTQATNKLIDIAKNDKSDKMRLEAIRALRNNNSPEVIKLLQSLLN